jgi:hypothetical protein
MKIKHVRYAPLCLSYCSKIKYAPLTTPKQPVKAINLQRLKPTFESLFRAKVSRLSKSCIGEQCRRIDTTIKHMYSAPLRLLGSLDVRYASLTVPKQPVRVIVLQRLSSAKVSTVMYRASSSTHITTTTTRTRRLSTSNPPPLRYYIHAVLGNFSARRYPRSCIRLLLQQEEVSINNLRHEVYHKYGFYMFARRTNTRKILRKKF